MERTEGTVLIERVKYRMALASGASNLLGALDLFLFTLLLLPAVPTDVDRGEVVIANAILFVAYMPLTLVLGRRWADAHVEELRPWLESGRAPTPAERDAALRLPLAQSRIAARFWIVAAVLFTVLNAFVAPQVAAGVPFIILLGGITTTTMNYLLVERIVRPVTSAALTAGLPDKPVGPGVGGRVTIVWISATGMPLLGIGITAIAGVFADGLDREVLALSVLFLVVITVIAGLLSTVMIARSLAEPLAAVRDALERVEGGDLDVAIPVDDGSEIGLVEAGFNRMAEGLRERERVQEVFGRHVGRDVARAALEGDLDTGGEVREVGALFVDVVGSTALAAQLAPQRVVALLNGFFEIVVAVTESHGGMVNKFEGDGAVCVFGAPVALEDPAGSALAAAREMRARLLDELPQLDAAIGVSAGEAVAGNVGARERYEYTVIGDPVNEAARLSELAKTRPERLVASDAAIERAGPREAARWALRDATVLRGRAAPTRIAIVGGPD